MHKLTFKCYDELTLISPFVVVFKVSNEANNKHSHTGFKLFNLIYGLLNYNDFV